MKNKTRTIVLSLLMIGALIGGVLLVKNSQNTQKGAYFAGTKILIMPSEISGMVGEQVSAQLFVETDSGAKISSIDTQICYGNQLVIDQANPSSQVELNSDVLATLIDIKVVEERKDNKCLRLIAIADLSKKVEDLQSGMQRIATIHFVAGSVGSGNIQVDRATTKVGGYNPVAGATDSALQVGEITDATYSMGGVAVPKTPGFIEKILELMKKLLGF